MNEWRCPLNIALKRRIASLEQTWPRRKSLADFCKDAVNIVRLTGTTYRGAYRRLLNDLSREDVERLKAEAEVARSWKTTPRRGIQAAESER